MIMAKVDVESLTNNTRGSIREGWMDQDEINVKEQYSQMQNLC